LFLQLPNSNQGGCLLNLLDCVKIFRSQNKVNHSTVFILHSVCICILFYITQYISRSVTKHITIVLAANINYEIYLYFNLSPSEIIKWHCTFWCLSCRFKNTSMQPWRNKFVWRMCA
jgi:hypothetical protein